MIQYYDIGFSVYKTKDKKPVVAYQRYEAFKRVMTGSWEVKETGLYSLCWDNTFSWARGKEVKYNVYRGTELLS